VTVAVVLALGAVIAVNLRGYAEEAAIRETPADLPAGNSGGDFRIP
jgi:hypothetical protein